MYSQEFWDIIYKEHFQDAPWMDNSWKKNVIETISDDLKLLGKPIQGLRLLDYGCGNGYIGVHFSKMGCWLI